MEDRSGVQLRNYPTTTPGQVTGGDDDADGYRGHQLAEIFKVLWKKGIFFHNPQFFFLNSKSI